ncbi:hypothetical protein Tco_0133651 [Tanacetum coccineum]
MRKKKQSTTPIPTPSDDRERDEVAEATILSLTLHKTALVAKAQENIAKVQEKVDEEEIEKMVKRDEDEESYASEFVDSLLNDDVDDSGNKIEPMSHKENSENVDDDDEEIEKEKKHEDIEKQKINDNVEKTDEVVKEKDIVDDVTGSMEIRKEQKRHQFPHQLDCDIRDLIGSLIPLSRGSFDVIVGMDWLSKRKFMTVCHEKVVRIPLEGDEILRVHGERTQGVSKEEHEVHLKLVLESMGKEKLYTKFLKCYYRLGDALSRKERVKLRRVRGMILAAQSEAFKQENILAERLHGLDPQMERKGDESLYFMDQIWVLLVGSVMDEAHASRYWYSRAG